MKDDSDHLLHFLSEEEPYVLIYFYILIVAELNHIVLYLLFFSEEGGVNLFAR